MRFVEREPEAHELRENAERMKCRRCGASLLTKGPEHLDAEWGLILVDDVLVAGCIPCFEQQRDTEAGFF